MSELYGSESVGLHTALVKINDLQAERDALAKEVESLRSDQEGIIRRDAAALNLLAKEVERLKVDAEGESEAFDELQRRYVRLGSDLGLWKSKAEALAAAIRTSSYYEMTPDVQKALDAFEKVDSKL